MNKPSLPLYRSASHGQTSPTISKPKDRNASPMPMTPRHLAVFLAVALPACALSGCGTINEKLAAGVGDVLPQWAGGLPADAPPRRGTPQYDEYMKERERKRLEPAANKVDATKSPPSSSAAVY